MLKSTILALFLAAGSPALQITDAGKFHVDYKLGAAQLCLIYHSMTESIELNGKTVPYEPARCWMLDENDKDTSFETDWGPVEPDGGDWQIHATLAYWTKDGEIETLNSNTVIAKH